MNALDPSRAPLGIPDSVWPYVYTLLVLALCWSTSPAELPLITDNQHYYFISERFASGVPPHISHFDPKNALSMMMTGGAIAVGRLVGIADIHAARAISIGVTALCYGLLWATALRYSRSRMAAHLSVLAMFSFNQFVVMGLIGARPKVFMVLFIICVLWTVQARRPILAGISACAAFLCWQPALLFAGVAPLPLLFWERPVRAMVKFAIGFLALFGLYEAYFIYNGAFYEQIEQAYRFPSQYMSGVELKLTPMRMRFGWLSKTKEGLRLHSLVPLAGMCFVFGAAMWTAFRYRRAWELARRRPEWLYFVAVAGAGLVFLHLDYQGFPDRFIIDPMLAIGCAMVFYLPTQLWASGSRASMAARSLLALAVVIQLASISQLKFTGYRGPVLPRQLEVAEEVGRMIEDGKTVWAVGCTHLLALARHDNWVPYGFFFRGTDRYMSHRYGDPYVPYKDGELPDVILLSRGKLGGLETWLPRFYERELKQDYFQHSIALWNKRDEPLEYVARQSYTTLRMPGRRLKKVQREAAHSK